MVTFSINRIPSKLMVLGEYLALSTGQALVWTFPPYFELVEENRGQSKNPFHQDSPAGQLWKKYDATEALPPFTFHDPFEAHGGFGASTAQFALLYRWKQIREGVKCDPWQAWLKYQEFFNSFRPSGVDLIAQMGEGLQAIDIHSRSLELFPKLENAYWLVFSASHSEGRKTNTHEHLKEIFQIGFPDAFSALLAALGDIYAKALSHLKAENEKEFGMAMNLYANTLSQVGFEAKTAKDDRMAFQSLPQVLGVKGCGAMLSDCILVLAGSKPEEVIELGRSRGLRHINI